MAETDDETSRADETVPQAEAPVTAAPEPSVDVAPVAEPPRPRTGFVAPVLGGVLAAATGFGLAQLVPGGWPLAQTAALEQQVAAQAAEIAKLETRLAGLEGQPVPDLSPLMDTLAALNGRVAGLETGPAEAAEQTAALAEAVTSLQADLAALQASGPIPANVTALAAEAEARLQEAEAQAARMKAEAEALNKAAATRAALVALETAVDRGAPYAAELAALGLEVPEALASAAETGVPSLASLQDSFPEASRAALEAALRADMGDSWTERATSFFRSQTGARSLTPREGSDPDAVLSRAEAALASGNLGGALQELAALPEVAQAAMADWRGRAEQRQAALQALADLAGTIGG